MYVNYLSQSIYFYIELLNVCVDQSIKLFNEAAEYEPRHWLFEGGTARSLKTSESPTQAHGWGRCSQSSSFLVKCVWWGHSESLLHELTHCSGPAREDFFTLYNFPSPSQTSNKVSNADILEASPVTGVPLCPFPNSTASPLPSGDLPI